MRRLGAPPAGRPGLHWADESTLDFLAFLVADAPRELALVLTYRTTDLPAASALPGLVAGAPADVRHATVAVRPLSVGEVRRLAGTLLSVDTVSDELAKHLHDQTAGLPFAVEELVRLHHDALARVDGWRTAEELEHVGVPAAVSQALRERMTSLTKDAWLVTRAVAVLAAPVGEGLVGRVAGLSSVRTIRALSRALSAVVLEERADGRYGFLHALAAQAIYDDIPGPERRWLHRRAAEALQSQAEPAPPAQLAHHFRHAGLWRPWTRYAEAAADAARSIGDDRSAARLLEQALGAPQLSRAARVRMARKLGTAALYSAQPERAIALLQRIRDEQPMPIAVRGELRYRIARLHYQSGDPGPWREEIEHAVVELQARPALAAEAMVTIAWPVVGQGAVERDLAWLERAVEAAARSGDPAVRAGVAGQRAAILLSVGDPEGWQAAATIPRGGRRIDERLTLLWALQSLATTCIGLGHFERADACLREVAALLDELPHVAWGPWLQSARASLDWRTGNWGGLEARMRSLTDGGSGGPALAIGNEMVLASLLLSHNRVRDAERRLRSIRARARDRGWMGARVGAATGLARILLARGEPEAAVEAAAEGLEVLERKGIWVWGRELVPVAVRARLAGGDADAAQALTQRFATGTEGRDAPAARAASRFCDGAIAEAAGRHALAAQRYAAAEQMSSDAGAPYEAATARAARGRCLLVGGDDDRATVLLSALEAFDALGAGWDSTQLRAELRAHHLAPPSRWRGGRRPYGDELSPREEEVARLAATGHKNREIAETLFISRRTVETHVASALRKVGAESRGELAAALSERGVDGP